MKKKKRTFTLLEIMIVIFLITLITGAIGYNMKGSLDRGKKFRTIQAMSQLKDLLLMAVEEGTDPEKIAKDPAKYLKDLGIAKDPDKLVCDGWGEDFDIKVSADKTDFEIKSLGLDKYEAKNKNSSKKTPQNPVSGS
ncbi:MAG: type II secretion system protein [Chlamydiota bacterium]